MSDVRSPVLAENMQKFLQSSSKFCSRCCRQVLYQHFAVSPAISTVRTKQDSNLPHVKQLMTLIDRQLPACYVTVRRYSTHSDNSGDRVDAGTVNIPFWGRLLIVSGIAGAVCYILYSAELDKQLESEAFRYKEFENIHLGGDWVLTDHHGNKRSSTDFRGQWVVMYMGFTHCPDICPEEMEKLGNIVQDFDKDPNFPDLQPVFITLDPERDTPAAVRDYLKDFTSPHIVGFTGSEEEIKEVAKKFRAYYGKGERDTDNDYIVDHTIIIYLINPRGQFVNYYGYSLTAEQITESIKKHVTKYNEIELRHH